MTGVGGNLKRLSNVRRWKNELSTREKIEVHRCLWQLAPFFLAHNKQRACTKIHLGSSLPTSKEVLLNKRFSNSTLFRCRQDEESFGKTSCILILTQRMPSLHNGEAESPQKLSIVLAVSFANRLMRSP